MRRASVAPGSPAPAAPAPPAPLVPALSRARCCLARVPPAVVVATRQRATRAGRTNVRLRRTNAPNDRRPARRATRPTTTAHRGSFVPQAREHVVLHERESLAALSASQVNYAQSASHARSPYLLHGFASPNSRSVKTAIPRMGRRNAVRGCSAMRPSCVHRALRRLPVLPPDASRTLAGLEVLPSEERSALSGRCFASRFP